jgi:hypothetical protein
MKPIRNPNRARRYIWAALLAAVGLALAAPAAEAESLSGGHDATAGNELTEKIGVMEKAYASVANGFTYSNVTLQQQFTTRSNELGSASAFFFRVDAYSQFFGIVGFTEVRLYVKDEQVLPPARGNAFALQGAYPGSQSPILFDGVRYFYHTGGRSDVAVGPGSYKVFATWYICLDFDLAGHAYSLSDVAISGRFDTTKRHRFYAHLPENVVLAGANVEPSPSGGGLWLNLQDPSPPRVSRLSCNLNTRDSSLWGNWCRFQQDPLKLDARLIDTAVLGGLTYTEVIPVVEDEIPAVDRYLIDKRRFVRTPYPRTFSLR